MGITIEQAKALTPGTTLYHRTYRNADGTPQRWRVSGKPRLWKRTPERVEVPVKHGLRVNDVLSEAYLNMVELSEEAALTPSMHDMRRDVQAALRDKMQTFIASPGAHNWRELEVAMFAHQQIHEVHDEYRRAMRKPDSYLLDLWIQADKGVESLALALGYDKVFTDE